MEELLLELWDLIPQLKAGTLAAYSTLAMLLVRVLRLEEVQRALPSRLRWPEETLAGKLIVVLVAVLVNFTGALVSGMALKTAALSVIPTALGALITHKATQTVGNELRTPYTPSVSRPSSLRALDVVLPPHKDGAA